MSDDEWVSVYEKLPIIGKYVYAINMRVIDSDSPVNVKQETLDEHQESERLMNTEFGPRFIDEMNITCTPTHWKYIPEKEKRPDFSKLKKGDFLMVEKEEDDKEIVLYPCFFYNIENNHKHYECRYFYSWKCSEKYRNPDRFDSECIKKITRINIEKQTFEEI